MLDPFDYKEPSCALCSGKEFYNPNIDAPASRIPVDRIIQKLDGLLNKNDMAEAERLLEYWQKESRELNDKKGELSVTDELVGLYRKTNNEDKGLSSVARALFLIEEMNIQTQVSVATIYLNCATTKKAFGQAESALPLYEKAEKIYLNNLSPGDKLFAGLYNNKALTLVDLNRFDDAKECYRKAIEILKGDISAIPDLAITYVNLSHALYDCGEEKSLVTDNMFKAYELLCDERINKDGYYAYVLTKCAPSFEFFGYKKIATQFLSEANEIYERA